jgi:4-amino-4-deoxy-L-arabinose transferase-like glycosyltransferase
MKLRKNLLKPEILVLLFILILSAIPRFFQLGYSHFYGDEIKTLYLDKTVSATDFFLSQRKGPVQFLVVWVMEKFSGGFFEFWTRLPFAIAGLLSVLFFYLFVKKTIGFKTALISSVLYSFSGFSVAFSRTAQYQSFLMLFCFMALYLFELYTETGKKKLLFLSSLLFAAALLTHYDALFFILPLVINQGRHFFISRSYRKTIIIYFIVPLFLLSALFYLPYFVKGIFFTNTINYLNKRVVGKEFLPNYSLFTINVYNPGYLFVLLVSIGILSALLINDLRAKKLFLWFFTIFLIFEVVFQNPGTHIQNYLIPLYISFGMGVATFMQRYQKYTIFISSAIFLAFLTQYVFVLWTFVPAINRGYPWKSAQLGFINFERISGNYQLFMYGFPYNVGWEKVQEFMYSQRGVRGYYTNDNESLGDYYLLKIPLTGPGTNFLPQYYIHFFNSQELQDKSYFYNSYIRNYEKIHEIYQNGEKTAEIYKFVKLPFSKYSESPSNDLPN